MRHGDVHRRDDELRFCVLVERAAEAIPLTCELSQSSCGHGHVCVPRCEVSNWLARGDAKRRLRLLFAGSAVSVGPVVLLFVISSLLGVSLEQYFPAWVFIPTYLLLFLFPATLAYVIVAQREMDLRVVIRQGLQYAVARRGVWALRLLLVMVLARVVLTMLIARHLKLLVPARASKLEYFQV
jgi:hypothetical protein